MPKLPTLLLPCLLLLAAAPARAQRAYPMLMSLKPVAAQVGQTAECTIKSRYSMFGAYQVLVTGQGVSGEVVPPEVKPEDQEPNLQELKVRFTVAPDAQPGLRDFRLATPHGASTVGQLVIVRDPVIYESGSNNSPEAAQEVSLPATLCGAIERNEDVDYFKFRAEAGQACSFHVRGQRLQDRIHDLQQHVDPILTLRNAHGSTLAASDNYFFGDPFLHHTFAQAGEYYLEIRDVRYQGNQYWEYSITASSEPFVTNVYPMGVAQGQAARLQLVGYQLPVEQTFLNLSAGQPAGPQSRPLLLGEAASNPAPLVVSQLPVFVEEPRDNDSPGGAQPLALPAAIAGRIEREGDVDCFSFAAMKGERYSFEVIARRHQSGLDSQLRILDAAGRQLALNDDMRLGLRSFADSWIEDWTAPADGSYVIEVRDVHLRGGEPFVYFIEATRSRPYFELYLDTDKTQLTPGTHGVVFARVVRKNGFAGEVQLHIDGLPEGVQATCGRILGGKGEDGSIVLGAAEDATLCAANVTVRGTASHPLESGEALPLEAVAVPYQETYQPGGGRGHWPVEMHTVAVGQASDIRAVQLSEYDIRLKPGESKKIDVTIQRAEGFDKNVTLDVTYNHLNRIYGSSLPAGVTLDSKNSKTLLTGTTSEGHLTLTAAKDAAAAEQQVVPVMANVSLNFVMKATYAAAPLRVTVEAP